MPAEDSGGTLPPDPTWRERAPYSVRFLQPAKLSFRNHTFELEQSDGSGSVDAFDQVTCWPSGELLARAMDHPSASCWWPGALCSQHAHCRHSAMCNQPSNKC